MGIIDKYSLDRLEGARIEVAFDCPRCKKQRIRMRADSDLDFWDGVECPKCNAKIILDSFSLAVIRENGGTTAPSTEETVAIT